MSLLLGIIIVIDQYQLLFIIGPWGISTVGLLSISCYIMCCKLNQLLSWSIIFDYHCCQSQTMHKYPGEVVSMCVSMSATVGLTWYLAQKQRHSICICWQRWLSVSTKVRAMDTEPTAHGSPWCLGRGYHLVFCRVPSCTHWIAGKFPGWKWHSMTILGWYLDSPPLATLYGVQDRVELEETGNSDLIRFCLKALQPERQLLGRAVGGLAVG